MSDIEIFDPVAFFSQRVKDLEQEMIAKAARSEILKANRSNLVETLRMLAALPEEQQKALQMEMNALQEAREQTQRALDALRFELDSLAGKLTALRSAAILLEGGRNPGAAEAAATGPGPVPREQPGPAKGGPGNDTQAG